MAVGTDDVALGGFSEHSFCRDVGSEHPCNVHPFLATDVIEVHDVVRVALPAINARTIFQLTD